MDLNSNPATATNATDSSSPVGSLVSSLSPVELSPSASSCSDGAGPISRMPDEVMQLILAKMALEADANKLLRLRLVSKWWNSQVEDYCRRKKCLFVDCDRGNKYDLAFPAPVIVRSRSIDSLGAILKLFPNTDKLIISDYWTITEYSITKIRSTAGHLNSLASLKQLQLCGDTVLSLPYMAQTLTRLEYISLDGSLDDELLQFVSHLGPRCVRVYLGMKQDIEDVKLILNWHDTNPRWLANVTHLQMPIYYENQYVDEFVHHLSLYATSLESLNIAFSVHHFDLTLSVLGDLAKLTHLNELKFEGLTLDIALLDRAVTQHRLPTLSTVLACAIFLVDSRMLVNADSFTRVLSTILPNLVDFKLEISSSDDRFTKNLSEIDLYLHRFPKLAKHKIEYV